MTYWQKFKCWVGLHDYVFIRKHHFYKGDKGGDLKCKNCGKERVTSGIAPL